MKIIFIGAGVLIGGFLIWFAFFGVGGIVIPDTGKFTDETSLPQEEVTTNKNNKETMTTENKTQDKAIITTNKGTIVLKLYTEQMPITAGNFTNLAESGFYDGTKIHRVIEGFIIQGGDPNSKGSDTSRYGQGGPGYVIEDEFVKGLSNLRGTISMANAGPGTGGSQFFINIIDNTGLDFDKEPLTSKHPVFGEVLSGMEVVDAISKAPTGAGDIPLDPIVIESLRIE